MIGFGDRSLGFRVLWGFQRRYLENLATLSPDYI